MKSKLQAQQDKGLCFSCDEKYLYAEPEGKRYTLDVIDWKPLNYQCKAGLEAASSLGNMTSLGPDGMTNEFFKRSWNILRGDLVEVF